MQNLTTKLKAFLFIIFVLSCLGLLVGWKLIVSTDHLVRPLKQSAVLRNAVSDNFMILPKNDSDLLEKNSSNKTFLILYWGFPWNLKSYVPPEGKPADSRCEITHDRNRINTADLVMFHYSIISKKDMPWKYYRNKDQIFVWWSAENPAILLATGNDLKSFNSFFNWTMTYRRDSDVLGLYGYRNWPITALQHGTKVVDDIIAKKKKLAIWCVSQCKYTYGARMRMKFALELRKSGLQFDGCGKCFPNEVSMDRSDKPIERKTFGEYKFYFAFENGLHCKDYITEKFWENSLISNTVPIVWGPTKSDVLAVAPLDSFVFAEDFESPAKLAEYINYLDSNETEYRKYFRWREDESMTDEKMIKMTKERYPNLDVLEKPKSLCDTLVENKKIKIIKSLSGYFMDSNPWECIG